MLILTHVGFVVRRPHPSYLGRQRELPPVRARAPVPAGIEVWCLSWCVTGVYGPAVTQPCRVQAWEIPSGQTEILELRPQQAAGDPDHLKGRECCACTRPLNECTLSEIYIFLANWP